MAKRAKRAEKGSESLKKEIEKHFEKIEQDIREGNIDRGRYHVKEIDNSLLTALKLKIEILGKADDSVEVFKERLEKLREKLELGED